MSNPAAGFRIREAQLSDVANLLAIEQTCFSVDRLSKRSFRHHIQSEHSALLLAEDLSEQTDGNPSNLLGYGLIWLHKGKRLSRLYSLAVMPHARGRGIAQALLDKLEKHAAENGKLFMRLEVSSNNQSAITLYKARGYRIFGEYCDYYQDHSDALRMQKQIRTPSQNGFNRETPWYKQSTEFNCGPASLMMAMASLKPEQLCEQTLELDIWREATTIFMTTGHGGCHPFGLALAAKQRGFDANVMVNQANPLFIDGVRTEHKKYIMTVVHEQFAHRCQEQGVDVHFDDLSQKQVEDWLREGWAVLVLISTYRLDGKKAPHWVVVTGMDDLCFYLHDPDCDDDQLPIDCQYMPIARTDFDRMTAFGARRLRAAVAIRPVL